MQALSQLANFHIYNGYYLVSDGWRWIRTTEAICSRFTVCPLWPLGNPSKISHIQLYDIVLRNQYKADDRTRTDNLLITNQLLCQLSHIGLKKWDLQGSNLWPSACKADALPAELRSHTLLVVSVKRNSSDLIFIQSWIKTHYKRPRRDSNPWPPPWQGGALTNWATRPSKIYTFKTSYRWDLTFFHSISYSLRKAVILNPFAFLSFLVKPSND